MPEAKSDAVRIVLEGDAARLSEILPGLRLYEGAEVVVSWPGGSATFRAECTSISGSAREGRPRRLQVRFAGSIAEPGNVSRPRAETPPYGLRAAPATRTDRDFLGVPEKGGGPEDPAGD